MAKAPETGPFVVLGEFVGGHVASEWHVMNFSRNLEDLERFLEPRQYRWALVGGLALAAYGLVRTTLDLYLVVDADSQEDLVGFMTEQGFETLHRSAAYSNHLHPDSSRGRANFIYIQGTTCDLLFGEAVRRSGPHGRSVRVPKPEHLIAMKVLAIKNDPSRTFQDLADIRYLFLLPGVDHEEVRSQFQRYGLLHRYDELQETL